MIFKHSQPSIRALCLSGGSIVALLAATPAMAQSTGSAGAAPDTTSTIVVTGIRGSLQRSLNIKKKAVGVVDAISAEDIGKFPDANLAQAMERIPGVTVSRALPANGNTSTGDAATITVRGFGPTFNETLFDERQIATGTGNRSFDFSSVGADFVGEIDVLKTPDSSLSSGAIGATVDIKFPKPFDHPGLRASASLSGSLTSKDSDVTPNGGFLISDTFGPNDNFGVLLDFASTEHKTDANHVSNVGWEGFYLAPSQLAGAPAGAATTSTVGQLPSWFTQEYQIIHEQTDDSRQGGRLVLQWAPTSNLELTLNDNYTQDMTRQVTHGLSWWFNSGALTDVTRASNGTITNFIQPSSPTDLDAGQSSRFLATNDYGFNVKWDVSSKFKVIFDVDNSNSWLNPGNRGYGLGTDVGYGPSVGNTNNGANIGIAGVVAGGVPYPVGYGPGGDGNVISPNLIGSHVQTIGRQSNHDSLGQVKLMGEWDDDNLSVRFGVQYMDEDLYLANYGDFSNNDWQAYAGYGPSSDNCTNAGGAYTPCYMPGTTTLNPGVTQHGVPLPASIFASTYSTAGFIPGGDNGKLPSVLPNWSPFAVLNYLQALGNPQTKSIPGANTSCCSPAFTGIYTTVLGPSTVQQVNEATGAAFINATESTQLAGMPFKISVGVRAETTFSRSEGLGQLPVSLTVESSDHTAYNVAYGAVSPIRDDNSYRYLLPSLDFNLAVLDNLKVRFDASRTLTRPPIDDLSPDLSLSGTRVGALTATGDNPYLLPYLSDNIDLGAEWYYSKNSYISADYFVKYVTNFIVGGTTQQSINGVVLPGTSTLAQFATTSIVNGPAAQVDGLELAVQQVFGETGFGFQANVTLVDTNKPYDADNLSVSQFAVTGLANSANLVAFYDKHGFQARVAVNWRDSELDHFGSQQNNSLFGTEPTFIDSNTQVDFSTSYDVNKHLSVFFEGLNLTNANYSTRGRFTDQVLDVVNYGSRFTFGVHMKL